MPLQLERPLVFFDLETTGTDVQNDRIVEISLLKVFPDGREDINTSRINPGIPIPAGAAAIHGITDAEIANSPTFAALAPDILRIIENSDLCGYNMIKFDFPLLRMEFYRNGVEFNINGIRLIDPMSIFFQREPRNLAGALRFYCNQELQNAHAAEADTIATRNILFAQLERYDDLPNNIGELAIISNQGNIRFADISGKLIYNDQDEVLFNFGRHQNERVVDRPDYANWMLGGNFPEDTKQIIRGLIND